MKAEKLFVRFGRKIKKRFISYEEAALFKFGLRFEVTENKFDERRYIPGKTLSIATLIDRYIDIKDLEVESGELERGTLDHIRSDLKRVKAHFKDASVKEIQFSQLQLFFLGMKEISPKTRANIRTNLRAFYNWLRKSRFITAADIPEFPDFKEQMGWRKTIDKDLQDKIIEKVRKLTVKNPRIWFAMRLLSTYIVMRPGDIKHILEEDVDLKNGTIAINKHKTVRTTQMPRYVPLLPEDLEFIKSLPRGFPKLPFFRLDQNTRGGGRAGNAFGNRLVDRYWRYACKALKVEGVTLYGGTRHSTAKWLKKLGRTAEDVKRLTQHRTNKAFNRYLEIECDELREGYALARTSKSPGPPMDHRFTDTPSRKPAP